MTTITTKNINTIVEAFLTKKVEDVEQQKSLIESWNSKEIQQEISKLKRGKAKKIKDPKAPKKYSSVYLFFCKHNREKIKKQNKDAAFGEIAKLVSTEWKKCKEKNGKEYKKYVDMAVKDKERYELEWIEYEPSPGFTKNKKTSSTENKIKGKRNSYILFCNDMRSTVKKNNSDKNGKEITKLLSQLWKQEKTNESDEWKKYQELAKKDKERYEREKSDSEGSAEKTSESEGSEEKTSESEVSEEKTSESEGSEEKTSAEKKKKIKWKKGERTIAKKNYVQKKMEEVGEEANVKAIKATWKTFSNEEKYKYL